MTNATMTKFGFPETVVRDYEHWCVLLRPAQPTLGALVLACKDEATAFSAITPAAFTELATATRGIEHTLATFRAFDRINYLMLMMVDPDVHFHVLPRYSSAQDYRGITFADAGWPGPPELSRAVTLEPETRDQLVADLRRIWTDN
jgi:diadenosine tetraphosphate (Ap4A) HIT family hydrolase